MSDNPQRSPVEAENAAETWTEKSEAKTKKEKKNELRLVILLLVAALVILAVLLLRSCHKEEPAAPTYESEVAAMLGQLEHKSAAEIQEELNRVIEEGMFHIAINSDPVFADGTAAGNLEIENVPNNRYLMRVEITLEDTGELVYSTKYIEPNKHIQSVALDTPLEAGDYFATATFFAYDPESLVEMGSVSAKITLHVLN